MIDWTAFLVSKKKIQSFHPLVITCLLCDFFHSLILSVIILLPSSPSNCLHPSFSPLQTILSSAVQAVEEVSGWRKESNNNSADHYLHSGIRLNRYIGPRELYYPQEVLTLSSSIFLSFYPYTITIAPSPSIVMGSTFMLNLFPLLIL